MNDINRPTYGYRSVAFILLVMAVFNTLFIYLGIEAQAFSDEVRFHGVVILVANWFAAGVLILIGIAEYLQSKNKKNDTDARYYSNGESGRSW